MYLLQSKWPYKFTDPCRFPGRSGFCVKFACWETRSPSSPAQHSNKGSVVTAGRYMCGIFSPGLSNVSQARIEDSEKSYQPFCYKHIPHSDISDVCACRGASAENLSTPQRTTENKTDQFKEEAQESRICIHVATYNTGEWSSALSTCLIWILHVKMNKTLSLSFTVRETTALTDTLRL